jgi:hypothetical protein
MASIMDSINLPYDEGNKKKIISAIKAEIEAKGLSRIGEHADRILKPGFGSGTHFSIKRRIKADITMTGKYIAIDHPTHKEDFEILKNVSYKSKWHDYKIAIVSAIITGIVSLIVGIVLYKVDSRSKDREYEQLKKRVDQLEKQASRQTNPQKK